MVHCVIRIDFLRKSLCDCEISSCGKYSKIERIAFSCVFFLFLSLDTMAKKNERKKWEREERKKKRKKKPKFEKKNLRVTLITLTMTVISFVSKQPMIIFRQADFNALRMTWIISPQTSFVLPERCYHLRKWNIYYDRYSHSDVFDTFEGSIKICTYERLIRLEDICVCMWGLFIFISSSFFFDRDFFLSLSFPCAIISSEERHNVRYLHEND